MAGETPVAFGGWLFGETPAAIGAAPAAAARNRGTGGSGAPPAWVLRPGCEELADGGAVPASRRSAVVPTGRPRAEGAANRPEKRGPDAIKRRGGAPKGERASSEARGAPDYLLAGRLVPSVPVTAPFGAPPPSFV